MSFNLLDTAKGYFTADFVSQASSTLGESNTGILKALSGIIPTGLAGILRKATSGTEGANSIFNFTKEAAVALPSSPNFGNLSNLPAKPGMGNFLSGLFGEKQSGIAGMISKFAGIKDSSVSSLMSIGLPAIMGLLGKHVEQNHMTASGLSGFLSSQKDQIMNALPSGLSSLTGMLGFGSVPSLSSTTVNRREAEVRKSGTTMWIWLLLFALVAAALVWYFMSRDNKSSTGTVMTDTTTVAKTDHTTVVPTPVITTPEFIKVKLPTGNELDAYRGGIEDQLVTFLNGNWKSMSDDELKNKWFNFDNLNFNTGSATLTPGSQKQLNNIAEILKAFPDAKIKIGGYTDAAGSAAANKKLSQDRADAAKSGLEKLGVGSQVIGAEGYGSEFAKYPATASEEERVTDRHVSISVRK
ncbi:MAG TPA: OmpA family protein [Chitinophagaceae bacterium]|nr:OmpA family protein [Chitinophagaceae bacterium]